MKIEQPHSGLRGRGHPNWLGAYTPSGSGRSRPAIGTPMYNLPKTAQKHVWRVYFNAG